MRTDVWTTLDTTCGWCHNWVGIPSRPPYVNPRGSAGLKKMFIWPPQDIPSFHLLWWSKFYIITLIVNKMEQIRRERNFNSKTYGIYWEAFLGFRSRSVNRTSSYSIPPIFSSRSRHIKKHQLLLFRLEHNWLIRLFVCSLGQGGRKPSSSCSSILLFSSFLLVRVYTTCTEEVVKIAVVVVAILAIMDPKCCG